jgi:hypothetical protein
LLTSPHGGMTIIYFSNSCFIVNNAFQGYCEARTYEEAVDRFTLEDMHKFIAFERGVPAFAKMPVGADHFRADDNSGRGDNRVRQFQVCFTTNFNSFILY